MGKHFASHHATLWVWNFLPDLKINRKKKKSNIKVKVKIVVLEVYYFSLFNKLSDFSGEFVLEDYVSNDSEKVQNVD